MVEPEYLKQSPWDAVRNEIIRKDSVFIYCSDFRLPKTGKQSMKNNLNSICGIEVTMFFTWIIIFSTKLKLNHVLQLFYFILSLYGHQ